MVVRREEKCVAEEIREFMDLERKEVFGTLKYELLVF